MIQYYAISINFIYRIELFRTLCKRLVANRGAFLNRGDGRGKTQPMIVFDQMKEAVEVKVEGSGQ
jgi:hypothetical protein